MYSDMESYQKKTFSFPAVRMAAAVDNVPLGLYSHDVWHGSRFMEGLASSTSAVYGTIAESSLSVDLVLFLVY